MNGDPRFCLLFSCFVFCKISSSKKNAFKSLLILEKVHKNIPGITMSPRPSIEKGRVASAVGNSSCEKEIHRKTSAIRLG
jgi:hypothetical protein